MNRTEYNQSVSKKIDTDGMKWTAPFVYQTDGGLLIESFADVLPIYSPENQELTWFEGGTGFADINFLPHPCPASAAFEFEVQALGGTSALSFDDGIGVSQLPSFEVLNLQAIASQMPDFVASVSLIRERIVSALRYYCKRLSKIVEHQQILFAGRPFLVPQSTQEVINALVRDDIDRFQTIALAREHSPLNTLSVVQNLKRFCRERLSKWLSRSRYLQNSWNWFAEYAISADLSASFGLG